MTTPAIYMVDPDEPLDWSDLDGPVPADAAGLSYDAIHAARVLLDEGSHRAEAARWQGKQHPVCPTCRTAGDGGKFTCSCSQTPTAGTPAAPTVEPYRDFWAARPQLQHIHDFARARRAAPWAALGVTLTRLVTSVPPFVVLPPIVGGHASLNTFVALVGGSGAGKGAAESAAADAIDFGELDVSSLGSGEGIAHLFMSRNRKGDLTQHTESALLSVPEIDSLTALGSRTGATLMPELRKAWSGERLGFGYADPAKRLPVPSHKYRLCLVAGVQPGRAGGLLGESDGGTPQRFIWLPATDPIAPDEAPVAPAPWKWKLPTWPLGESGTGRVVLPVCEEAQRVIIGVRLAQLRGQVTALDGHALLARLKVAAALALLDNRAEVSAADWELSEVVATVSQRTRNEVVAELERVESVRNRRRGEAEADRAVIVDERTEEETVKRVARTLVRKLTGAGDWIAHSKLRRDLANRSRSYFDAAIDRLLDAGQIDVETVATDTMGRDVDGRRYRVASGGVR
ncbi:hypothetical protein ACIBF5_09895 [Micromonospora sp. NPDC050417]|uniref:hypothetical protein n=1 Tax=Micromonospora sp. NPDC050417 TaxID=3364280 RepID=UPI003793759E